MATWHTTQHRIPERKVEGKRLGRNFVWDSRNAAYPYRPDRSRAVAAQYWGRHIPILNQGDVGSCTGNAETGELGCDPFWGSLSAEVQSTLNERLALSLYSAAETIDGDGPYPPNDNGSSGPSVAKAARNLGLISGWQHVSSVTDMTLALQDGPVIIGINWYDSFDTPDKNSGMITISAGAQVRGGHEVLVRGVDPVSKVFHADNSWGDWGQRGGFLFGFGTMDRLFGEGGDCTAQTPVNVTPPGPVPAPDADAALWTVAGPWAAQERTRPDLVTLQAALRTWHAAKTV